jgi:hypothetical protein
MRPSFSRFAVALALAVGTVACSDQPVSPTLHEKVTIKKVTDFETYQVVDFTVDTEGGWFRIGPHSVYFPPNSICEPSKSTYGPYHWDTPCTVIADSIEIHAEVQKSTTTGKPAIRFWPDLRFAPSTHVDSTGKRYRRRLGRALHVHGRGACRHDRFCRNGPGREVPHPVVAGSWYLGDR